jgi:hypothetical protein
MRWALITSSCLLTSACLAAPVFEEHFETGDEGAPAGWRFLVQRGECSGAWDENEPAPGGRSIRMDIGQDATARATWDYPERIPIQPSTAYRLSVRVMRAQVGPEGRVYLILYEDGVQAATHWHTTPYLRGTQDWRTYEIAFMTRPDSSWVQLQCKLWESTGHAWFDDIVMEQIDPAEIPPAQVAELQLPPDDGWPLQLIWYPAHRRPDRTLHLLAGSFNPVAMFFWGKKDEVADPHLVVEAPAGLEVNGPVVHGRSPMPEPVEVQPEPVETEGARLLRWRIPIRQETLVARLGEDAPSWTEYHFIYLEPGPDCPEQFEWRWQLEVGGKAGPMHTIAARIEPRLGDELAPVGDFALYAQHSGALRHPTREGRARILEHLYYAAIRGGLSLTHYQKEYAHLDDELHQAGFFTWAWDWHGYGGAHEDDQRLVFDTGEVSPRLVCPQVQAERGEPFWSDLVEGYRKTLASGLKTLIINYEPPCFNCCFCERCREAFAGFAKLDPQKVAAMTPKEIQELPDHLWGRFRAGQNERIVKGHAAAIHQVDPEVSVGICGPPYSEWNAQRGMDIRLFEPDIVIHAPMIYRPPLEYESAVRSTCENVTARVLPFLLASDLAVERTFPLPREVRLNMLATALSGGDGAILWVGIESLDGEYMNALRRSLEEIRQLQPSIVRGERLEDVTLTPEFGQVRKVSVNGEELAVSPENSLSPVRWWAWRSQFGHLLGLINYDSEEAHKVRVGAEGIGEARALFGPAPAGDGDEVVIKLEPYEFAGLTW